MKKILILLLIHLLYLNSGTIKPKRVKAKDRTSHHRSSKGVHEDILFSSSEATAHISTELSFALSTEATSYDRIEEKRERRERYIEVNRQKINLNMAQANGEHLSTLLKLLELKEDTRLLTAIQDDFEHLSQLDEQALLKALIEMKS
jgi:hypothetical protein